jgi:replication factor C small subunit
MAEKALWYEKYRPRTLDDFVWLSPYIRDQIAGYVANKSIPSLCLAGGPGRGKTSLALLLKELLEISDEDALIIPASVDNSVEVVRNKIIEFCELGGWSGLRLVILDEADNLSHAAQAPLRNVIDTYSDSVRFIFTCNYPHRIIEPLWSSRMIRIDIDKLPEDQFLTRMMFVLDSEKVSYYEEDPEALIAIKDLSYPDLRKAINLLQDNSRDSKLRTPSGVKATGQDWESYFRSILTTGVDPLREITKIRETLLTLTPDEMEDVYRFLYHNGSTLFGNKQMRAILYINNGQKSHRQALLPDMILLEVFLKLMVLMNTDE